MKNKNLPWIIAFILLIAVGVLIFFLCNKTTDENSEVERLKKEIQKTKLLVTEKTNLINTQQRGIDSLQTVIDNEPKNDEKLNNQYNEKIQYVNLFTVADQQAYFDERTGTASNPSN